jgi:hypothetical protein
MQKKYISIIVLVLSILVGAQAMAVGDLGKVCLFSGISGVITLDGKPVANARLVRTADRDGAMTDETTTDENGHFSMPPVFERTITKYLPQEFVASQEIYVYVDGMKYKMWSGVKRKAYENAESRGKPLIVTCELSGEEQFKQVDNSPIFSLCEWEAEADKIDTGF